MMSVQSRMIKLVFSLYLSCLTTVAIADPLIIYLSRHAEKETTGSDPNLSEQGVQRAQNIALLLKNVGIKQIYSTPFARTRQTAEPIAKALSLTIQSYDPTTLAVLASKLKDKQQTALVLGHSNTTPELIRQLGGDPGREIDDLEFDRLYQLIIESNGQVTTIRFTSLPSDIK